MSPADLARAAEVTPASVTFWLDGSTKSLKAEKAALLEQATGYRASWIVTGKGPKKAEDATKQGYSRVPRTTEAPPAAYGLGPILAWEHPDDLPEGDFVMIPRLDVHLSAGNGAGSSQVEISFDEAQPQAFRTDWMRKQRLKPNKVAAMTARGNSMHPTIEDGDSLLVDTSQTEVTDGRIYALWYDGGERVKRLYRMPGGGLRIRSDNASEHPEIVLGPEYHGHVRIIGLVVHRSGGL